MLGLDNGNGCSNHRFYYAYYRLLDRGVYDLKVSNNFLKTGNYFRELVYICEPGGIVKMTESRFCYSCSFFGDVEKRVFWLDGSYAINNFLEGGVNGRSLFIACVILELVDSTGKAFRFC